MSAQCAVCGAFDGHESWCQFAPKHGTTTGGIPHDLREADDAACKEQMCGTLDPETEAAYFAWRSVRFGKTNSIEEAERFIFGAGYRAGRKA